MNESKQILKVQDMVCVNCQKKIEAGLSKQKGILKVKASYELGQVTVVYDKDVISINVIKDELHRLGYPVANTAAGSDGGRGREQNRTVAVLAVIAIGYLVLREFGLLDFINIFPEAEAGMGYGMLFVIGIMTSFHCVGMCGGLNLSQSIGRQEPGGLAASLKPGFLYNFGRVVSYTVLGGIIGGIGSVMTFSGGMRGIVQLVAGLFMVIMALGILNVAPIFKKLTPHLPAFIQKAVYGGARGKGPLLVGLLNGFMPCGPLQGMQLYALSTGSPVKGALSMMVFSLGTMPVMLSLSALSGLLTVRLKRAFIQASAVLVLILGVSMFSQGMALSGLSSGKASTQVQLTEGAAITVEDGVQKVSSQVSFRGYQGITVAAGMPVQWNLEVPEGVLNGCNYRIYIPDYGIEKILQTGDNIIEFFPEEEGTVNFSCWMGMIRSKITVTTASAIPNSDYNDGFNKVTPPPETNRDEEDWEDLFGGQGCC